MTWKSESNTHLILARDPEGNIEPVLNEYLDNFIVALDPHFALFGINAVVTSAIRTRKAQMELIRTKALELDIVPPQVSDVETADLEQVFPWGDDTAPLWRILWSQLLADGQMINPPEPAKAEFEYIHADGRHIPPGHEVGISEHQELVAIDVARTALENIVKCLEHAVNAGMILKFLLEPNNHCVHTVNLA